MQYCFDYWDGEYVFQVVMVVLVYYCYCVVGFYFGFVEYVGQVCDVFVEGGVVVVYLVVVDDFMIFFVMMVGKYQVFDQ